MAPSTRSIKFFSSPPPPPLHGKNWFPPRHVPFPPFALPLIRQCACVAAFSVLATAFPCRIRSPRSPVLLFASQCLISLLVLLFLSACFPCQSPEPKSPSFHATIPAAPSLHRSPRGPFLAPPFLQACPHTAIPIPPSGPCISISVHRIHRSWAHLTLSVGLALYYPWGPPCTVSISDGDGDGAIAKS